MNKLMFLVLFAMVYLSMAATTVKPGKEKPIKNSTLAPSTSTVKPNRVESLTETFKKIVEKLKKVDTGIKGWSNLTAGRCQWMTWFFGFNSYHYRCVAYIPKEGKSKGSSLTLQIDINLKNGRVELYNVQNGTFENGKLPVTYDFWSDLRDKILEHTKVNCKIHWGKEPNKCDVSININNN